MEGTVLTVVWGSPAPVLLPSLGPTVRARLSQTHVLSPCVVGMEPVCKPGVAGWPGVDMSVQRVENSASTAESGMPCDHGCCRNINTSPSCVCDG